MVSTESLAKITPQEALDMFNSSDPHLQSVGRRLLRQMAGNVQPEQTEQNGAADLPVHEVTQKIDPGKIACTVCGAHQRIGRGMKIHMSRMHPDVEQTPENTGEAVETVTETATANSGNEYVSLGTPARLGQNDTDAAVQFVSEHANALGVTAAWRDGTYVWLAFAEKPSEEIRQFMKDAGLFFASRTKRWYYPAARDKNRPKGDVQVIV